MKLRRSFSLHQLFFALGITVSCFPTLSWAQDKIFKTDNQVQDAKIVGVVGSSVMIEVPGGKMGVPLAAIRSVEKAAPPEVAEARAAFAAKDYPKALSIAKKIADQFKGLPVDWAQEMTGMVGDIYLSLNKLPEAEAAYKDFQKFYSAQGGPRTEVGLARIAYSKNDVAGAKSRIGAICSKALEDKSPAPEVAQAYSQAFYLMGQILEGEKNYPEALENYLRTVTLYYHDPVSLAGAQARAAALRQEHQITVP